MSINKETLSFIYVVHPDSQAWSLLQFQNTCDTNHVHPSVDRSARLADPDISKWNWSIPVYLVERGLFIHFTPIIYSEWSLKTNSTSYNTDRIVSLDDRLDRHYPPGGNLANDLIKNIDKNKYKGDQRCIGESDGEWKELPSHRKPFQNDSLLLE